MTATAERARPRVRDNSAQAGSSTVVGNSTCTVDVRVISDPTELRPTPLHERPRSFHRILAAEQGGERLTVMLEAVTKPQLLGRVQRPTDSCRSQWRPVSEETRKAAGCWDHPLGRNHLGDDPSTLGLPSVQPTVGEDYLGCTVATDGTSPTL